MRFQQNSEQHFGFNLRFSKDSELPFKITWDASGTPYKNQILTREVKWILAPVNFLVVKGASSEQQQILHSPGTIWTNKKSVHKLKKKLYQVLLF